MGWGGGGLAGDGTRGDPTGDKKLRGKINGNGASGGFKAGTEREEPPPKRARGPAASP